MEQFVGSDLVLLTLTVGFYCLGSALYSRTKFALLHPVLLGFVAMILYLKLFGIGYEHYRRSTELLNFGLGLSVVALGYLMYEQLEHMRGRLLPILVSVVVGCVVGVLSVVYLARMLGADRILQTSLAPKSVTVPNPGTGRIAVSVAEPLGGIITITSVVVFCVGIFGSLVGPWLLRRCGVTDPMAQGFALGSAAHGIGTARAIEIGALEGALSGLAMALMGIMTALLLLESGKDLNGEVTVPTDLTQEFKDIQNANGTTMGLRIGETVRRIDLLNAMLIVSANDAASVIAYDVGGSVLDFVKQMNARAQELGCTGTNFTCAHGLFDYGNVSTAQDLAKIAAACAANQTFAQVAGTASYVLPATNLRKAEHTISSSNSLMNSESANYREYVRWVKGGFTTLAGRCIVAFAEKDGHTYGLVILGCDTPDHLFAECDDLFDWAFASFADRPLVDTQTVLTTVDLTKCRTEPTVALYAAAPVSGYGHADDIVTYSFDLPESIAATVKSGSVVGTATVYLDGDEAGTVDLVTHREYVSDFRTDLKATLLLLCALILILCALGFVTLRRGGHSCRGRWLAEP